MPGNSFQNAQTPDGKYAVPAGELHLLDEGDRNTDGAINVNPTTAWVEHDLSGRVPKGTKALWGFVQITRLDASGILMSRDGSSTETDNERTYFLRHGGSQTDHGWLVIIKATDGVFDIKEYDATFECSGFFFLLHGYFL